MTPEKYSHTPEEPKQIIVESPESLSSILQKQLHIGDIS